ncbi:sigma-70 family RNA polymerase sigma factor [bacterium]|nr:sigma-70 family RNA polymerase sigma factor [bacterium]
MADSGMSESLFAVIDEHYGLVYRYASRLSGRQDEAEDLTQQTFLSARQHLEQLRNAGAVKSWLCTIVRNLYLRSQHQQQRWQEWCDDYHPVTTPDPKFEIDPQELQAAIDQLPEEFRTPLILFYFREFSYKEIATQLQLPMGTVMSRLSRAKTQLRTLLTSEPVAAGEPVSKAVSIG